MTQPEREAFERWWKTERDELTSSESTAFYAGYQACAADFKKMLESPECVEEALIAFLTEKSAQMGEPFYREFWEEYKRTNLVEYDEEIHQMKCAISAIINKLYGEK